MIDSNLLAEAVVALIMTLMLAMTVYMIRAALVSIEKLRVLEIVIRLVQEDKRNRRDFEWRYQEFDSITHSDMLIPFWKSVKSFYKDRDCIKKHEEISWSE